MAKFNPAFNKVMKTEGGYVNDPDDLGGETYKGIARTYHKSWSGWVRIDQYKEGTGFPTCLDADRGLQRDVMNFYKEWYWDAIGLDDLTSQEAAEELFDMAVHLGVRRAVLFLQRGLNVLNRRGVLWPDLVVDGAAGARTIRALSQYEAKEAPNFLIKTLLLQRGSYYIDRTLEREASEKYIRGWLRRLRIR